jgi:hypothetical protein
MSSHNDTHETDWHHADRHALASTVHRTLDAVGPYTVLAIAADIAVTFVANEGRLLLRRAG